MGVIPVQKRGNAIIVEPLSPAHAASALGAAAAGTAAAAANLYGS